MIHAVTIRPRSPSLAVASVLAAACASEAAHDGGAASTGAAPSTAGSGDAPESGSSSAGASGEASGSSTAGVDSSGSVDGGTTGPAPTGLRYDEVRQRSAHNSYQRDEAPFDQLVYHRIRSVELDIHVGKTFEPTEDGVWYVYHTDVVDDDTWCVRLGHCLDAVGAFTDAAVEHEVLTLWIDLKDEWDAGHGPDELDAALRSTAPHGWRSARAASTSRCRFRASRRPPTARAPCACSSAG